MRSAPIALGAILGPLLRGLDLSALFLNGGEVIGLHQRRVMGDEIQPPIMGGSKNYATRAHVGRIIGLGEEQLL